MPYSRLKSLVRSRKKFKISNLNKKYDKPMNKKFEVELMLYENGKKVLTVSNVYHIGSNINYAITHTFYTEIENMYPMKPKNNYFIDFKVYTKRDVYQYKYKKTPVRYKTSRRDYILKERVNIYED